MQVEVEIVGKPNRWVVDQTTIRIGRSAKCDITLPARQFPNVAPIQAELLVAENAVRVAALDASQGELLLNGAQARIGDVVLSGDILRLGDEGPELAISYVTEADASQAYMPTRVMNVGEAGAHEATRLMSHHSRTIEAPVQASAAPVRREVISPAEVPAVQPARPAESALGAFAEKRDLWPAASKAEHPDRAVARSTAPPSQAQPDPAILSKLRNLQIMQSASLGIIILLGLWAFQLQREVTSSHDELRALRAQDQNAVAQLTPSLDARLNIFGQRMDAMDAMFGATEQRMEKGMDEKMKAAEEQLFTSLDARMKTTEDRMVNRMNTELPSLLDKYVNAKLLEMKH